MKAVVRKRKKRAAGIHALSSRLQPIVFPYIHNSAQKDAIQTHITHATLHDCMGRVSPEEPEGDLVVEPLELEELLRLGKIF